MISRHWFMEWTNIVANHCPEASNQRKDNFIQSWGHSSPTIGDQLIHWLCNAIKPTQMPIHEYMWPESFALWLPQKSFLNYSIEPWSFQLHKKEGQSSPANRTKACQDIQDCAHRCQHAHCIFEQCHPTDQIGGKLDTLKKGKQEVNRKSSNYNLTGEIKIT